MNRLPAPRTALPAVALALGTLTGALSAQQPTLHIPAGVPLSPGGASPAQVGLTAPPGRPYALFADLGGGPRSVLGLEFLLDVSPNLVSLRSGVTAGVDTFVLTLPPSMPTLTPVYFQAVVADPQLAPRTGLALSNGESLLPYDDRDRAIIDRFDDPRGEGFTGNFDDSRRGVLAGGALRRRVHQTVDPQGVPFPHPLQNPLNPSGARTQMVYRPRDLGGDGFPEDIIALRWRPVGPVVTDRFEQIEIRLGHTPVTPDYTVDPWSALPQFPNSGLDETFASNYQPLASPQTVFQGNYTIRPGDLTPRGYLPFPQTATFAWSGADSLLLEMFVPPQQLAAGLNGSQVRLMVQSSPRPNARVFAAGDPSRPLDPYRATTGRGDNSLYDLEIEFLRTQSVAISPWRQTAPGADYLIAGVAARQQFTPGFQIDYRGADDSQGGNATPWSGSIDRADGHEFIQYRVTFGVSPSNAVVAELDSLVITWR